MSLSERRHLYLPERDRSFWKADGGFGAPLRYLAWGYRDFARQPIPVSRHEGWVCVLIEEGSPTMVVRRREVRMSAGTLAVIGPDCPFGWQGQEAGPCRFLLWMWERAPDAATADLRGNGCTTRRMSRPERGSFAMLHDLCRREVLRASGPDATYLAGCRILFDATLRRAMSLEQDVARAAPSGRGSEISGLARAWLAAHLDSREPVARLCDYLNVSQSTLYRVFVAQEGTSPLAWFHAARMEKARELLTERSLSVKEAAYTLGYEHANDLSRAYRKHFGRSPTGPGGLGSLG